MVSLSSDELPNECSKKRPLENNYHSIYFGITPKYKVCKVSAVRDFPLGCGSTPKVDLNHREDVVVSINENMANTGVADGVNDPPNTEIRLHSVEAMDCRVNAEQNEKLDRLAGEVLAPRVSMIANEVEEQTSHARPHAYQLTKDMESSEIESVKETIDVQFDNFVKAVDGKRSSPLVETAGTWCNNSVLQPGCVTDGDFPVGNVKTLRLTQFPIKNSSVEDDFSPMIKNKYRRRRVSAARDFPPFCGTDAPKPCEQGILSITEASKGMVGFDRGVVENEVIETLRYTRTLHKRLATDEEADSLRQREVADLQCSLVKRTAIVCIEESKGAQDSYVGRNQLEDAVVVSETMTKKEKEDAGEIVGKEIGFYSQNGCEVVTTIRNALSSGDELFRPIVQGLMAEPYCSWRQGKKTNLDGAGSRNEIVVVSQDESDQTGAAGNTFSSEDELVRPIVQGLMAEPYCPWRQGKQTSLDDSTSRNQVQKTKMSWQQKSKAVAKKSIPESEFPRRPVGRKKSSFIGEATDGCSSERVMVNDGACGVLPENSLSGQVKCEHGVTLPSFGPKSPSHGDARSKVRETLRLFHSIFRKITQGVESKTRPEEVKHKHTDKIHKRIDLLAAGVVKEKGKEVNTGHCILGEVPGVEVGDAFQYRVELALVGVHRLYQAGIDSMHHGGKLVAASIVSSGAYDDDMEDADVLIYSGQGGNVVGKVKIPEDQKLEKGNLALRNSGLDKNPVRVIRGSKETRTSESTDRKAKSVTTYVYDGLYTVENYWEEKGPHGKMVFMFKLVRIPGQPELVWKEVKSSKKSKVRHGICVPDISEGKESLSLSAVNTIDGAKPPPFKYIKKMMYPENFRPSPPKGCDCLGKCSDSKRCSCTVKNGGEIPYNHNGAIVEVKPLVYECGPSCKCPPNCYNRVSQHGIKIPLEIFKTNTRGWGVRALTSIPSGTFICEYAGELLEDKEAEGRIGNDEYLFDIGQNYNDCAVNSSAQAELSELVEEGRYTIDALQYGNVGRFINHSCSPNLYAQNVLYDHEDKKRPHIMLFAADNIPPLKELSYHYNYTVDQVYDSNGNIKAKRCFCGSSECTGRMY